MGDFAFVFGLVILGGSVLMLLTAVSTPSGRELLRIPKGDD